MKVSLTLASVVLTYGQYVVLERSGSLPRIFLFTVSRHFTLFFQIEF
jgi:hypothetical protein